MAFIRAQSSGGITLVDLGSGTSFNVSSHSGYQNFTVDNFLISSISNKTATFSKTGEDWSGSHTTTTSGTFTFTKTYNSNTGVLSCYGKIACSHSGSLNHNGNASQNATVHAWLKV